MKLDLSTLDTEQNNARTRSIDRVSTLDMLAMMNEEDATVAEAVRKALPDIAAAVDLIQARLAGGGRLFYIGAGNSGRLGVLDACECPPTFGVPAGTVIGIVAGGYAATVRANEGSEDDPEGALRQLQEYGFNEQDALVGLSASGRTPYVAGALRYAAGLGAATVAVSCVREAAVSAVAEIAIEVITGAEVIAGSTRLKAGTAQKMVLNMLSTGVMIKSGKVYGNYMVDVRANNEKLVERSKKIIMDITGVDRAAAEAALAASDGSAKLAVFMLLSGLQKEAAAALLAAHDQTIYKALQAAGRAKA